jgi:hypothetical protein
MLGGHPGRNRRRKCFVLHFKDFGRTKKGIGLQKRNLIFVGE